MGDGHAGDDQTSGVSGGADTYCSRWSCLQNIRIGLPCINDGASAAKTHERWKTGCRVLYFDEMVAAANKWEVNAAALEADKKIAA